MIIGICFPNSVKINDPKTNVIKEELIDIIAEYEINQFIHPQNNIMVYVHNTKKQYIKARDRKFILEPMNITTYHRGISDIAMYVIYMIFFGKFLIVPPTGDEEEVNKFLKICKIQYKGIYKKIMSFDKKKERCNVKMFEHLPTVEIEKLFEFEKNQSLLNLLKLTKIIQSEIIDYLGEVDAETYYNKIGIFVNEFREDIGKVQYMYEKLNLSDDYLSDMYADDNPKIYTLDEAKSQLLYVKGEISKIILENTTDYIINKAIVESKKHSYLIVNDSTSDTLSEILCTFIGHVEQFKADSFADLRDKLKKNETSK